MKVAGVTLVAIKCPVDTAFFLQGCKRGERFTNHSNIL